MSRKLLTAFTVAALLGQILAPAAASAHESVQVGAYEVEYGWLNEPVIAGQANAIIVNISKSEPAAEAPADESAIRLTAPADGAAVQGVRVDIVVAFAGLADDASADGVHWHLMLDGQTLSMVPLHQPSVTVTGLGDGEHAIEVSLSDSNHGMLGHAAEATVTVAGGAGANTPGVIGVEPLDTPSEHGHAAAVAVDVSNLVVEVHYGGETKTLTLQPLGEDTPGQFMAPLTPSRAGQFTLRLSGKIDQIDVAAVEVQPEEVQPVDFVAFPKAAEAEESDADGLGLAGWLGVAGIVLGSAGVVLGGMALSRRK